MLSRFHLVPERNGQTDGQTDLRYQYRASVCWRAIKSHQQLDRCMATTAWAARHHSNSPMHHSLSPLAAWKPHQCNSAWRHRLKPKHRNVYQKPAMYVHEANVTGKLSLGVVKLCNDDMFQAVTFAYLIYW